MKKTIALLSLAIAGCGMEARVRPDGGNQGQPDLSQSQQSGDLAMSSNQMGCQGELQGCYTVYAHGDHTLYLIDLMAKQLKEVGPFKAPMVNGSEDVITDLAVAPDNTIYVVSHTTLYTADQNDGHVTVVGPVGNCGTQTVALTFAVDGNLYAADFKGAFCHIDITMKPPTVTQVGTIGGNLAIAGDLVAVADGTMYGTAYNLSDGSNTGTQIDNYLVKIDPSSGSAVQTIGKTGYPKMFGVAYANGQVFGFTHDQSGRVVTIDPKTGIGTLYGTFNDPTTGMPISFAGAGVNAMVAPMIM
jgi:hypothetical protein